MRLPSILLLVMLAFLIAETLLSVRVWAQVTSRPIDSPEMRLLFDVTQEMAEPFANFTHEQPQKTTGVVDFTVLVAMEAYFIALLAFIAIRFVLGSSMSLLGIERKRPETRTALPRELAPHWQTMRSPRSTQTYYVSLKPIPVRRPGSAVAGHEGVDA